MRRRDFVAAMAAPMALAGGIAVGQMIPLPDAGRRWKGSAESKVKRWDVITVGNLSRNRYWGEPDTAAVRSVLCTCTLIAGDGFALLIDPSVKDAAEMARELDRRTGKKPDYITACFVTHEHGDHWAGLENFPKAKWLAAPAVADVLNAAAVFQRKLTAPTAGCWTRSTLSLPPATPPATTRCDLTWALARS